MQFLKLKINWTNLKSSGYGKRKLSEFEGRVINIQSDERMIGKKQIA
jgi:hypothetical protein